MLNVLYFYISTFRNAYAVPNMAVFCSYFISCFPDVLLSYFLNDFKMAPFAPINFGINFFFPLHISCTSLLMSLYVRFFSSSFLSTVIIFAM